MLVTEPAGTAVPLPLDLLSGRPAAAALRRAAPALLVYAAVRLLGIAALAVWGRTAAKGTRHLLAERWDSVWYTRIAEHGYGYTVRLPDGRVHSDLAFFPLLPALERLIAEVTGLRPQDAGLLVSGVASLLAAWGIFTIGSRLHGPRTGLVLAALWGVLPTGVVQSMAYTESLFTALAAWSLYAVLTGRWVWAGTLAAFAGLTRPAGVAVVSAVWAGAALVVFRDGGPIPALRRSPALLFGVLAAPLGWAGYALWVGRRTGAVTGYLDVQARWGNGFDGGRAFARFVGARLAGPSFAGGLGLCAAVALIGWLYVLCLRQRQPVPVLVFCGAVVALALCGSGYFGSKPRLLMPAFPLLLPVALALARLRTARLAVVLAATALSSAVYGVFWLHGSGPP